MQIYVTKIKEDFRNCVDEETFKCEACEFTGSAMKDVTDHFLKTHRQNHQTECWECDKKVKTISELHVGTYHFIPQIKI